MLRVRAGTLLGAVSGNGTLSMAVRAQAASGRTLGLMVATWSILKALRQANARTAHGIVGLGD